MGKITDEMAYAFHAALTDGPMTDDECRDIKNGLKAAFAESEGKEEYPVDKLYTVGQNHCNCHPETCCCNPWAIYENGEKYESFFYKQHAEELCTKLNSQSAKQLSKEETELARQWFCCVQDVNPVYLNTEDFDLAKKIHEKLGVKVPLSIVNKCGRTKDGG